MSKKYIVAEINETTDFAAILGTITDHCRRFAVVNKVRGIFEDVNDSRRSLDSKAGHEQHFSDTSTNCSNNFGEDARDSLPISNEKDLRIRFSDSFDQSTPQKKKSRKRKSRATAKNSYATPNSEEKISCGICRAPLIKRMSVSLKKHVQRHLNISTVGCDRCDFEGVLRDHVVKHINLVHNKLPTKIKNLHLDADYNEKYEKVWESCFQDLPIIMPDMLDAGNLSPELIQADNNIGEEHSFNEGNSLAIRNESVKDTETTPVEHGDNSMVELRGPEQDHLENINDTMNRRNEAVIPALTSATSFNSTLEDFQDAIENTDKFDDVENSEDSN